MENRIIKIISIDDNMDNLISLQAILMESFPDAQLFSATSGASAMTIIKAEEPDVILLDIVMPEMDGLMVCKKLKADKKLFDIPVIFITANQDDRESRLQALEVGGEAFLTKPIDPFELMVQIRTMIKIRTSNLEKRDINSYLSHKIEKQTQELKEANIAALNMLEDLQNDNISRKANEDELSKLNRIHSIYSQINELILFNNNRQFLFQELCRIVVEAGKFRMSWIGLLDEATQTLTPTCWAGIEDGYLSVIPKISIANIPEGRGPTGTAMRENRVCFSNDFSTDMQMIPWRQEGLKRGFHSSIALPLKLRGAVIGAFTLYSGNTNFFSSEEEIILLEKISANISYALEYEIALKERISAEQSLHKISQAVEQCPVSIVITSTEGIIEYVNPKFLDVTGYTLNEVLGENPRILKSGETSLEEYKRMWQLISNGGEWSGEFHNKKKNGELFWESANISPIKNKKGEITNYLAIKEDITERKKSEQELLKAKEHAEESDRLKSAFLANMSHEIRTPMNGILGFAELLKEPHLSGEDQQDYIQIIEKSGERMLNIINDIMSISKLESGQMEIHLTNSNMNDQIQYIYTFFQYEAAKKGIKTIFDVKLKPAEAIHHTDKEKVYAILTNLVKNAIKFTSQGSIEMGCVKKGPWIEFFIKDTGNGIAPEQMEFIFDRFRQGSESLTRNYEGAGLGLAITKAYVEMLGGKIWLESTVGMGSTFYFTLPSQDEESANAVTRQTNDLVALHREVSELKKINILIAEDDEMSELLITRMVKNIGSKIRIARTGMEAVELCRNNLDLDLILMDMRMPEMDGYEATRQIRKFNKTIVIIAQTAFALKGDQELSLAAGCTDYIAKPIKTEMLLNLIRQYFKK